MQQTEDDKIEFQRLMRRHRGVLRVCIMNVKGLKAADLVGTNDVQVEVTTDSEHFEVGAGGDPWHSGLPSTEGLGKQQGQGSADGGGKSRVGPTR